MISVIIAVIVGLPGIALATIKTLDFSQSETSVSGPLLQAYDYQSGQSWDIDTTAKFDLGEFGANTTNDLVDQNGSAINTLTLLPLGPDGTRAPRTDDALWWNTDWNLRDCHFIDHSAAEAQSVSEYQIRFELDVESLISQGYLQADTGDLRAVASDGSTQLPLWVDSASDAVWVQVDSIAVGQTQTVCIYYDHNLGDRLPLANHTEEALFTYSSAKEVYVAVGEAYSGGVPVEVAAYVDGTEFTSNGTSYSLDANQLVSVDGVLPATVVATTGPLASRGLGSGFEPLLPISWAGQSFTIPAGRSADQRLSFYAPFGETTVQIYEGAAGTPLATLVIADDTSVSVAPSTTPILGESLIIEADRPVLVLHDRTTSNDSFIAIPFLDDEWFGVGSNRPHLAATANGTHIDEFRSDTTDRVDHSVSRGTNVETDAGGIDGGDQRAGTRFVLDSSALLDPQISPAGAEFSVIAQADNDGEESSSFLPAMELGSRYLIPTQSQYLAFSCPIPGTELTITPATEPATTFACTGPGTVGWANETRVLTPIQSTTTLGVTVAGQATEVSSTNGEPFFVYYEDEVTNGETNTLGMKQGRQYTWPEPVVTSRSEGLFSAEGVWLSADLDLGLGSHVFGTLDFDAVTPVNTDIEIQVATGVAASPTSFVGPDGTTATAFTSAAVPNALAFAHDGHSVARMQVRLTTADRTTTPQLLSVGTGYNLAVVSRALGLATTLSVVADVAPTSTSTFLLRLKTQSPDLANSELGLSLSNIDPTVSTLGLRLVDPSTSVDSTQAQLSGPSDPLVSFEPGRSYSLIIDASLSSAASLGTAATDLRIDVAGTGVIAETDFVIELSTP